MFRSHSADYILTPENKTFTTASCFWAVKLPAIQDHYFILLSGREAAVALGARSEAAVVAFVTFVADAALKKRQCTRTTKESGKHVVGQEIRPSNDFYRDVTRVTIPFMVGKYQERGRRLRSHNVPFRSRRRLPRKMSSKRRVWNIFQSHYSQSMETNNNRLQAGLGTYKILYCYCAMMHRAHVYHARIPSLVRRDVDQPVPVLRRSSLGHRHALPVSIAAVGACHSLACPAGETVAADAKSGLPVRSCIVYNGAPISF